MQAHWQRNGSQRTSLSCKNKLSRGLSFILFLLFILKGMGLSMGEGKEPGHHCLETALPRARAAPFMVITQNRVLVTLSIPSGHPKTSMPPLHKALTSQLTHNHSPPDPTTWSVTSSTVMVSEAEAQEEMQVCQLRQQKTGARSHPSNNVQEGARWFLQTTSPTTGQL